MKKSISILGITLLVSTTLLGAGSAFAEVTSVPSVDPTPSTATTPITANLTVDTTTKPVLPDGTNDGNHNNTQTTEAFGIAYTPKTLSGNAKLNPSGKQTISLTNNSSANYHVGVKDLTRLKHEWTLTAKLAWTGDDKGYMNGSTVELTGNTAVQLNNNGTLTEDSTNAVTGQAKVTVSTAPAEVMKSDKNKTQNGVYDWTFTAADLVIPEVSSVPAGTYNGNINWDLSLTPDAAI
ncbi:TPA: WxL domain-containing protein [Enterococcus faecalis]|nr:WxL domain-containing protein [Enterococcus faecalis]MCU9780991.1 WxL domain-containing protein [Enterococcus faecalis]TBH14503.1 hypothetical protein EYC52_14710 [Enterococcus faecalis]HCT6699334.1 WxL domain-containing protein [Enterococcus faecalis]HCW2669463.1 WxL domain-containing protein [Enterococcus faecalis]